jgi:DNA polymerase V
MIELAKDNKIHLQIYNANTSANLSLQLVENGISAGFPSPADDFLDASIDLNKALIKNKDATFYGRVKGDSMINGGLSDGDLLIIDKSLEPKNGKIAVCFIDGEFTVKRIKLEKDLIWLMPENKKYRPIKVTSDNDFVIWGIVTNVIKAV